MEVGHGPSCHNERQPNGRRRFVAGREAGEAVESRQPSGAAPAFRVGVMHGDRREALTRVDDERIARLRRI